MAALHSMTKLMFAGVLSLASLAFAGDGFDREQERMQARAEHGNMILPAPLPVPAGKNPEQIKGAIYRGLAKRGWTGKDVAPDTVEATYDKNGKHSLSVDIKYDAANISFAYKNSVNLKYQIVDGRAKLHRAANGWMKNLAADIGSELNQ